MFIIYYDLKNHCPFFLKNKWNLSKEAGVLGCKLVLTVASASCVCLCSVSAGCGDAWVWTQSGWGRGRTGTGARAEARPRPGPAGWRPAHQPGSPSPSSPAVVTPGIVMGSPDSSRYSSMLSRVPSLPNCHVSLLCIRASNKSLDRDQGFYSHTTLDWIGGNHKLLPADWTSIGSISIRNTIA